MNFLPTNLTHCMAVLLRRADSVRKGTGKLDWLEAFSNGTDTPALDEEVG